MDWKYEKGRIYSLSEDNKLMAEATYRITGASEVNIDHTFVNPSMRGQGVAGKMMELVADHLRENSLKTVASCSYANNWLKKYRQTYSDIISEDFR